MTKTRSLISALFIVCLGYSIYALFYLPALERKAEYQRQVISLVHDIATLKSRVVSLGDSGAENTFPEELIWNEPTKTDAELALQDSIVNVAGQNGITLIIFGASGLTRESTQNVVTFEFESESKLVQLYAFLADLEKIEPKVAVGMLRIRQSQGYSDQGDGISVYVQITLWAFRGGET